MFASYAQDADLKVNDVSPPTSKDEFIHSPEKLCTEIVVSDQTSQTRYHYKVQDTPGYDSMEVSCCHHNSFGTDNIEKYMQDKTVDGILQRILTSLKGSDVGFFASIWNIIKKMEPSFLSL